MSDKPPPIIIVGAGIGGLSAAIALRRAGFEAEVFERAPELREVGAGISVWPNASRLLRRWGVLDGVVRRGFVFTRGEMKSWRGKVLHRMRFHAGAAPHVLVHRADLHAALAEALPPWAVHTGAEFERYEETADGVRAWLGGLGAADGQALVGADGLRSAVRRQVLGDGAPVYRGYPVWRGVARLEGAERVDTLTESLGAGQRFGVVPIGGGCVAWWATANEPEGTDDGPSRREKLLGLFGDWHWPVPQLLAATPEDEILKNDTYDRPPVRGWGRGRVTLLGDAAHPTTPNFGQGGCMAIEDAAVLAACLAARPDDLPAALRRFERRRYGRTTAVTRRSLLYGRIGQWSSPLAVRLRDAAFRLTPTLASDLTLRRLFAFDG
ncbi:MAG TPA: FAD-dependent monooxygenase [Longimicrobium sp.]|jgi:2-polyprenyl-6-methoxyphenol hydroxylase-like FAD-dependent oxidoreductase